MFAPAQLRRRWSTVPVAATALMMFALATAPATAQPAKEYQKAAPQGGVDQPMAGDRNVFIATVHLDGNANIKGDGNHPAEPFPAEALPPGGGLLLTAPAEDGAWRVRAFVFEPRQVVVFQGAPVTLHFVGVQGTSHRIQIDGQSEIIELKRGEVKTVTIAADTPGVIGFRSLDHLPSMQGSIVVLPHS